MDQYHTDDINFRLIESHHKHIYGKEIERLNTLSEEKERRHKQIFHIFEELSIKTEDIEKELIKHGSYTHTLNHSLHLESIHELLEHPKYKEFYQHWLSLAVIPLFDVYDQYRSEKIKNKDTADMFYQNPYEFDITSFKIHFILDTNLEYINRETPSTDQNDDSKELYAYISGYPFKLPDKLQKFFTNRKKRGF